MPSPALDIDPPSAVLDTNVVLDLLLFADPRAAALDAALSGGRLRWLASDAMLDELADVLGRPFVTRWTPDPVGVLAAARARCHRVDAVATVAEPAPRCADPDDQKFIEFAWQQRTDWLLTRDRALLDLARPARARGLRIVTPAQWAAAAAGS